MRGSTLLLTAVLAVFARVCHATATDETNLRSTLSSGYDTNVRPTTPTSVYIYYNILALQSLDITSQEMTTHGWLTMYWSDSRFTWTPATYGGLSEIEVNFAWRPEFVIANSADSLAFIGTDSSQTRVRVYNNGLVRWNVPLSASTTCDVNIAKFPFDVQTCGIDVSFWSFTTSELDLVTTNTTIETSGMKPNGEWMLESTSFKTMEMAFCCPESSSDVIHISFTFARLTPYYIMNIIIPTLLLSICSIWSFYLPTDSGERLGFALTILLSYYVQMSIAASLMPTTSKEIPLIAMYLVIVLVWTTMVLCNLVMHVKLYFLEGSPPPWMQKMYRKTYRAVFFCQCLKKCKPKFKKDKSSTNNKVDVAKREKAEKMSLESISDNEEDREIPGVDNEEVITWTMTSVWMDRICFIFYLTVTTIFNIAFVIMLVA